MALEVQPVGRFGMMLHQAIDAKKLTLRDVAEKTGVTYEQTRKLIRQLSYPSEHMLNKLAKILDLDLDEMKKVVTADRIQTKFGKMSAILTTKNPELDTIEKEWSYLKDWQKDALNTMAKNFGREARSKN